MIKAKKKGKKKESKSVPLSWRWYHPCSTSSHSKVQPKAYMVGPIKGIVCMLVRKGGYRNSVVMEEWTISRVYTCIVYVIFESFLIYVVIRVYTCKFCGDDFVFYVFQKRVSFSGRRSFLFCFFIFFQGQQQEAPAPILTWPLLSPIQLKSIIYLFKPKPEH